MNYHAKIYIAAGIALIVAIALISFGWSSHKIAKLETAVAKARADARDKEKTAATAEIEAAGYKQKIDYLEKNLTAINDIAKKQDEELKSHSRRTDSARGDVERQRRIRSIDATTGELCKRLSELGYGCE